MAEPRPVQPFELAQSATEAALRMSIFAALAATATGIWMGGGKKRPEQRWSLAAALKKLWVPTFVKRTAPLCFSRNGKHTAMLLLHSAKESPGTASFTRGPFARNICAG